jgi:transposase
MKGEKILMSQRQLQRWHLMGLVEGGKITLKEANEKIGVSYRQSKRIRRAVREKGMKGLIHGNMGRPSNHRIDERLRDKVFKLSKEVYWDFNDTHFVEQLKEREGVRVRRETVGRKLVFHCKLVRYFHENLEFLGFYGIHPTRSAPGHP